ncbi:heme biosynthesis HemY N-terminal domain-containing protein [Breoghania sp.]|uniref:heme biosynthesis HemY N-terminal domain-containing protein n=1 Tax=Breoghania sp. TaxID=2065378 RepID=UPI00262C738B|nr:heme biosynthesis HemY N-terminal domain-containing protein [Breoghania sp.]MDJ0930480.1 heme biosynthesis HemY N-terminal domain-containing protein [Breoghania sp.]
MVRVLSFFSAVFVIAMGFAWLADRPGLVMIDWQGYRIEMGLMTLLIALGVLMVVIGIVWSILHTPGSVSRFFKRRRRDRGFGALSHGLIALGAGDARSAGKYGNEAQKLLKNEPAAKLLLAQSAQMAGKREEARAYFEAMLEDEATRLLGLHGLFVEAERQKEPLAARHYAEEAHKLSPVLAWADKAVLAYQAAAHDWEKAIVTLERNAHAKLIDKPTFRRQKAVLLTARAMELENHEPDRAHQLAMEAHGLAIDLVPAAVIAGRLLTRRGDVRKASKVLEATWKKFPHSDIAEAYAHVRPGDSARDRLKRVKALNDMRGHHVEGGLAIARAAIQARDWAQARDYLRPLLRTQPTQRVFLLMADLEESEHGDRGRVREWLSRAVRAPRDPAWTADGIVVDAWAPVSPITGKLDAFEWKVPVEHLGAPETEPDGDLLELPAEWPAPEDKSASATPVETMKPEVSATSKVASVSPVTAPAKPAEPAAPAPAAEKKAASDAKTDTPKLEELLAATAPKSAPKPESAAAEPDVKKQEAEAKSASPASAKTASETFAPAQPAAAQEPKSAQEPKIPADKVKARIAQRLASGKTAPVSQGEKAASDEAVTLKLETIAKAPFAHGEETPEIELEAEHMQRTDAGALETVGEVEIPRLPDDPGVEAEDDISRRSRKFF